MAAEPYFRTVRDDEVVVGIEEIAYVNIVPVVAPKGRGDADIFSHAAEQFGKDVRLPGAVVGVQGVVAIAFIFGGGDLRFQCGFKNRRISFILTPFFSYFGTAYGIEKGRGRPLSRTEFWQNLYKKMPLWYTYGERRGG